MKHLFSRLSPAQKIILSFLLVIFCGSLLLSLPWVQTESSQAGYLDHLFTAVSMVCVTGLFTRSVVGNTMLDAFFQRLLSLFRKLEFRISNPKRQ